MLVQFSITNFRSIKDTAIFSMMSSSDRSHERILIPADGKILLLPAAAIYGANAAGKSNILSAFQTMKEIIVGHYSQILKGKLLPYDPFSFISKEYPPTEFDVIFFYDGIKYQYGFSYNMEKILTEYLYHWPKGREAVIFERNQDSYKFMENEAEQKTLAGRTPENRLYLVSSTGWNLKQTENAFRFFSEELTIGNYKGPDQTIALMKENSGIRDRVLKELLTADFGISDVEITGNQESSVPPIIRMTHKIQNGTVGREYRLGLRNESKGTQQFFSRIGPWLEAMENGGILIVDEIEASMHPLLTRRLVEMMQEPELNPKRTQLIFTTHDALLLDLELLRRDQIWFAEKNPETLSTELFSLSDYSVRKDENVQKGYLRGRYGAIPFIGGDE